MKAMKGPGERLRQLLNINNPENTFNYEEERFEKRSSMEKTTMNPMSGPIATSARKNIGTNDNHAMDAPDSPTSSSTLQANGHKLPRPHVNVMRNYRNDSRAFDPQVDDDIMNFNNRQSTLERIKRFSNQDYPSPISPMNAEKSILVEKTPTTSRRKVTKTNAQAEGSRIPHTRSHSAGKHVTITTNGLDIPKQRNQDISSSQWDIPSPDYLDDSPTLQRPQKEKFKGPMNKESNGEISSSSSRSEHSSPSTVLNLNLSEMTPQQLEDYARSLKQPKLVQFCVEMSNYIRRLEQQAELREELLKRNQNQVEDRNKTIEEKDSRIIHLERELSLIQKAEKEAFILEKEKEKRDLDESVLSITEAVKKQGVEWSIKCRYHESGCPYRLPSMEQHEEKECKYKPARCPSLTCPVRPAFANLLKHIEEEHDGKKKGRDRVCRNASNHLISSYVNIDKEPVFYKNTKMTWVANELLLDKKYFYLECMRIPPDWHLWVYILGTEKEADEFQVTITLFREDEYGQIGETGFSAQRSYTGPVISIQRSKEEIAEYGLGFMVHDKQVRPLCGPIANHEEQLFGYEVTVYRK